MPPGVLRRHRLFQHAREVADAFHSFIMGTDHGVRFPGQDRPGLRLLRIGAVVRPCSSISSGPTRISNQLSTFQIWGSDRDCLCTFPIPSPYP